MVMLCKDPKSKLGSLLNIHLSGCPHSPNFHLTSLVVSDTTSHKYDFPQLQFSSTSISFNLRTPHLITVCKPIFLNLRTSQTNQRTIANKTGREQIKSEANRALEQDGAKERSGKSQRQSEQVSEQSQ